jgi:predicted MFS family arabinose efflux permease
MTGIERAASASCSQQGIGVGTLSGALGGYIPELLHAGKLHTPVVGGIRIVLLAACGLIVLGAWPIQKLRLTQRLPPSGRRGRWFHPFLRRFLPPFLLWNVVTGSFPAFGAIYLQQVLKIPLGRIGLVFSASQLAQFVAVLASPVLFRRSGLSKGIALSLFGTAAALALIGITRQTPLAVCLYVAYYAMMFMCEPGIYNLLMDRVPEEERSTASAVQNLSGAVCQAATAALTGSCIVRFGYGAVLFSNAVAATSAALLFLALATRAASNRISASPDALREAGQSAQ